MNTPYKFRDFSITDPRDIEQVIGVIHDEYFKVQDIAFDREAQTLSIPFDQTWHREQQRLIRKGLFSRTYEYPILKSVLKFSNITEYTLVDKLKMNRYDFNIIEYDEASGTIKIVTCVPLDLSIQVSAFEVHCTELRFEGMVQRKTGWFPIPYESGPKFIDD